MLDTDIFDETIDLRFPPSMVVPGQLDMFTVPVLADNKLFDDDWNDNDE